MSALQTARGLINSGAAKNVLVAHTQKWSALTTEDMIRFFQENAGQYEEWEFCYGMTYNAMVAMVAQRYMYETGTTAEQIAAVCVSLRKWAELNPNARFRKPMTIEDVMNSRMVTPPLRQLMCNVLCDGASAFIVSGAERAKDISDKPVYVLGEGHGGATHFSLIQKPDKDFTRFGFDRAGKKALEEAGITLKDVDIAEIYMAYPHFHLMVLEELGFCKRGEAGAFVMEGHTWPGGDLPLTTTGDAMSQGHTGTGVGMAIFVESVRQLKGQCGERQVKDAKFVLESCSGGAYVDSHVTILGKEIP
jgi:acetyl-CoA C-acetyltransferase